MKLAVGFITYNETTAKYLADFLPSLEAALAFLSVSDYSVYALDNSSPQEVANRISLENFNQGKINNVLPRRPLEYLSYGSNLGFSRAYNILITLARQAAAEYFLVINPDTVLDQGALKALVAVLDKEGRLAAVAPKILRWDFAKRQKTSFIDSLGLQLRPGLRFIDSGQGEPDQKKLAPEEILGPSGAAGLYRLSALAKIASPDGQYFDERMFMYKEDCDLAYRLFLAGYQSRLIPTALVYHDRTAAQAGRGLAAYLRGRNQKNRAIRSWSFHNQQLIYLKYWKNQNFVNRAIIIFRVSAMFVFSLMLEQFLLKEYLSLWRSRRVLTNIK